MLNDLKESIKKSGYLQKDLAKELHIIVIYLNRILNEKVPMTRKLADSLSQIKSLKVKEHELMYPHLKLKPIPWPF
jgi:plasmid maintenance system antidote protein VapI